MVEQYVETISGDKSILTTLKYLIDARVLGKMEIPETEHHWTTMVLEIKKMKGSSFLSMERIEGLESVLEAFPNREVSLEFMDKGGVPCRFRTRIVECRPKDILSELPVEIYRIQKRQYPRINALPGAEITFRIGSSEPEKGEVKDLSGGGAAFFIEKDLKSFIGNLLIDISLKIPEGNDWHTFHILQAAVRRMDYSSFPDKRTLLGIEFLEMSKEIREELVDFISQQQRVVIQRLAP
ncbi:MAG: flagellar brake protein [Thermodesulfobacteriota bacterium]